MSNAGIFPLIAGLVGSDSPEVGRTLHFSISVVIGATFGLLFRQDMKGLGSSIAWGITYRSPRNADGVGSCGLQTLAKPSVL
jgi:hypothetical protein